jgi:hypothetical protein
MHDAVADGSQRAAVGLPERCNTLRCIVWRDHVELETRRARVDEKD